MDSTKGRFKTDVNFIQLNMKHCWKSSVLLLEHIERKNIDIALIQEPYVGPKNNPFYKFKVYDAGTKYPRARIIIFNNNIDALLIKDYTDNDIITLRIVKGELNLIIVCAYFNFLSDIEMDLNKLENILFNFRNDKILIGIDSNCRTKLIFDKITNKRGRALENFIVLNNLIICNKDQGLPTFEGPQGTSNIDVTLTNTILGDCVKHWKIHTHENFSDHATITYTLEQNKITRIHNIYGKQYITKNTNWDIFEANLLLTLTKFFKIPENITVDNFLYDYVINHSIDDTCDKFQKSLSKSCNKTFKIKNSFHRSMKNKTSTLKYSPWWDDELTKLKKETNKARKLYQKTKSNETLRNILKETYLEKKRLYSKTIKSKKIISWKEFCSSISPTNPWSWPYKYSADKLKEQFKLQTIQKEDGTNTKNIHDTYEYILDKLFKSDDENNDNDIHSRIRNITNNTPKSINDLPITDYEIKNIINNLNNKKAAGIDGISAEIFKHVLSILPNFVTKLYQQCFDLKTFPTEWKKSKLVLLKKPNYENNDITSIRPISIICTGGKILEKIIYQRLSHYLYNNNLLHPDQFGFTPQKGTQEALHKVISFIQFGLQSKEHVVAISLDIKGAFDSAWWPSILYSLHNMNCPQNIYSLIQNYLNNRTTYICTNNITKHKTQTIGTPQGSACSPLFWNLVMDTLLKTNKPKNVERVAFADDIFILIKSKFEEEIQTSINNVLYTTEQWAHTNKLTFNTNKSSYITFTRKRQRPQFNIRIQNSKLKESQTIKYLGVTIDNKLNWGSHITNLQTKLLRRINLLSVAARNTWGLQTKALDIIYKCSIEPTLLYGIHVWYTGLNKIYNTKKLERVQRMMALKIIKGYRTISYEAACVLAKITPIAILAKQQHTEFKLTKLMENTNQINIKADDIEQPQQVTKWTHPARYTHIKKRTTKQTEYNIYTDGSKDKDRVGCAIAIYKNNKMTDIQKFRLGNECTNNQAEKIAILKATEYILTKITENTDIRILTDSKITLQKLKDNKKHDNIIATILYNISTLETKNINIFIEWVKAHDGIEGNEIADRAAKSAANNINLPIIYNKISKTHLKHLLQSQTLTHWQERWKATSKGRTLYNFIPNIQEYINKNHLQTDFKTTQIITGHGALQQYLYKFKINNYYTCPCDNTSTQDTQHLIYTCPLLTNYRTELQKKIQYWPVNNKELFINHNKVFRQFCDDSMDKLKKTNA